MNVLGPYKIFGIGSSTSPTPGRAGWYYPIYLDEKEAMKADITYKGKGIYFTLTFSDRQGEFYLPENYKFFAEQKDPIIYENYTGIGKESKFNKIQSKLSSIVPSQLPDFVQEEYSQFVNFLKAYYQFLEVDRGAQELLSSIRQYNDIDKTSSDLVEKFLSTYAYGYNPSDITDNKFVIKKIRDIYEKKGTEEAYKILFNILYKETIEFFYPNNYILKASDGQWFKRRFMRSIKNNPQQNYFLFEDAQIRGITSNATVTVADVKKLNIPPYEVYEFEVDETTLNGQFVGERVTSRKVLVSDNQILTANLTADIDGNILTEVTVTRTDPGYFVNQELRAIDLTATEERPRGTGARIVVNSVNNFNKITSIDVLDPGINYSSNVIIVADRNVPVSLGNFLINSDGMTIYFLDEHDFLEDDYIHIRHVGLPGSNLLGQYYIVPILSVIDKYTIRLKYPDAGEIAEGGGGIGLGPVDFDVVQELLPIPVRISDAAAYLEYLPEGEGEADILARITNLISTSS